MAENILIQEKLDINNCCICCETCMTELCALSCGHVFHLKCISSWLEHKSSCPICKVKSSEKKMTKLIFEAKITKIDRRKYFQDIFKNSSETNKGQELIAA